MNFKTFSAFLAVAFVLAISPANAQVYSLTQTSVSGAIASGSVQTFIVASATNVTTGSMLYVEQEAMLVLGVNGTAVTVARGQNTTRAVGHPTGAAGSHWRENAIAARAEVLVELDSQS